ncbi:ankyrin repeat-containing domain protein [Rhexocercosporidium sp. MPI-PUGE-AT-0058]|nr:ankyrin repeat-containing domain protein [Rhexocercosporidium sp. MPI-PUGE-AT-0058]
MATLADEIRKQLAESRLSLSGSFDFGRWSQHSQATSEQQVEAPNDSTELGEPSSVPQVLIQSIFLGARIADSADLQIGLQIRVGSSMIVHESVLDGQKVAVKRCKPLKMDGHSKQISLKALSLELRVLLSDFIKPHPNIVDLLAVSWIKETQSDGESKLLPLLIIELALPEERTLHDFVPIVDSLDFGLKGFLISDIISGLDAIHRDRFIHGDLKPENILIFRQGQQDRYTAKLADFGFSDDVEELPFGNEGNPAGGTYYWNAPECSDPNADFRTCRRPSRDLYSFGLVAMYIVASQLPFGPDRGSDWAKAYETVTATKMLAGAVSEASGFFDGTSRRLSLDLKAGWEETLHQYLDDAGDTRPNDLSDPKVSVGVMDEILWRQHVNISIFLQASWLLDENATRGYLPYGVTLLPHILAKDPTKRGRTHEWFRLLWIDPNRSNATSSTWRNITSSSLRIEWTTLNNRHAAPGYTANRVFGELSPTMAAALRRGIVSEIKNASSRPLESILRSLDLYTSGYPSKAVPSITPVLLEEMKTWATQPANDAKTISLRSVVLAGIHYGHGEDPPTVLTPEVENEVILSGLCLDLYGFEKWSGTHALNDSFRQLLDELLDVFSKEARLRILRLWHSAYRLAYVSHAVHWSRNTLCSRPSSDPQYDPEWNRIAQAIRRDDVRAFKQLFEKKTLPEEISLDTAKGTQNLMLLIIEQHLPNILAYLVEHKAVDLNKPLTIADHSMLPVQLACYQGNQDAAGTLLALGANPCSLFEFGFVKECIDSGKMESISLLLLIKGRYAGPGSKPALKYRDIQTFDFNKKEYDTQLGPRTASPILIAIAQNSWSTFAELVSIGVDINAPCFGRFTPLQVAVQFRRPLFVAALLDASADPSVQTHGKTPLHHFVEKFHPTGGQIQWLYGDITWIESEEQKAADAERHDHIILELLLGHPKTNLNARDLTGKTPFAAAMEAGQIAWAEKIVQAGGNPMVRMFDGNSPLHCLALKGMIKEARWLLDKWPNMVHSEGYSNRTPIHNAMQAGQDEMIQILLKNGHNITSQDSFGYTILHHTLVVGQVDTFHMIWSKIQQSRKDVLTIQDIFGRTLLHLLAELSAMRQDDFKPYISFLENDILPLVNPPEHVDHCGLTPLHFAAASTAEVCRILIDAGFRVDARDSHGTCPFDLASLACNTATLSILCPKDNPIPSIKGTGDDGKNSWRIVTILNDHINRVSLAYVIVAERAISQVRRAAYGNYASGLVPAIQLHRMGFLTHNGLVLPHCVFCAAAPVEVEGLGFQLLGCILAAVQRPEERIQEQPQKQHWFASKARKIKLSLSSHGKSKETGEGRQVEDRAVDDQATTEAELHSTDTHPTKPDILIENIDKLFSGIYNSLEAVVTTPSELVKPERGQDVSRADRISALLSHPDGTKRRNLIMSGMWESRLKGEEVEYLFGSPGKLVGFTASTNYHLAESEGLARLSLEDGDNDSDGPLFVA